MGTMMDYIYFAPNKEYTAFKIGFSCRPDIRLSNVDGNVDYSKTYLFECKNKYSIEDFCHRYFKDFNVVIYEGDGSTEWFDIAIFKTAKDVLIQNQRMLSIINHYKFNESFIEKAKPIRKANYGTMTEKELEVFLHQLLVGNNNIRNVAIIAVSHYMALKVSQISPLNMGDAVRNLDNINNEPLKAALEDYIEYRKKKDGLVFNLKAPLFVSQRGQRFSANSLATLIRNLYNKHGYPDCSSETGKKSAKLRAIKRFEESIDSFN